MRVTAGLLAVLAVLAACGPGSPAEVTITIRHSAFDPASLTVPRGVPVMFILVNEDPIDHEWIVGSESVHDEHRSGTHAYHDAIPTEVTVPALSTVRTTVTFTEPGRLRFICHLPGHEAYGMVGLIVVS